MRRTIALIVVLIAAAFASQTASAAPFVCNSHDPIRNITVSGGIVVPEGGFCILQGVTWSGGLTANHAESVEILSGSQGSGPVVVTGAVSVLILGSRLSGSQRLTGNGVVQIADNPVLGGGITCSGNGQLVFSNNTVSGPNQCAATSIFQQAASDCATAGGAFSVGNGAAWTCGPLPFDLALNHILTADCNAYRTSRVPPAFPTGAIPYSVATGLYRCTLS